MGNAATTKKGDPAENGKRLHPGPVRVCVCVRASIPVAAGFGWPRGVRSRSLFFARRHQSESKMTAALALSPLQAAALAKCRSRNRAEHDRISAPLEHRPGAPRMETPPPTPLARGRVSLLGVPQYFPARSSSPAPSLISVVLLRRPHFRRLRE